MIVIIGEARNGHCNLSQGAPRTRRSAFLCGRAPYNNHDGCLTSEVRGPLNRGADESAIDAVSENYAAVSCAFWQIAR